MVVRICVIAILYPLSHVNKITTNVGFQCPDIFCHIHTKISSSRTTSLALARIKQP